MKRLSKKQGCLTALVLVPLIAYGIYKLFYPTYNWHEKMTVSLETLDGEVSGSAVRSVKVVRTPPLLPQITGVEITLRGEAVAVKLDGGRYLFSLLGAPRERLRYVGWSRGQTRVLPQDRYPLLVTFDDINDPASVKRVDPNDLDAAFGLCPDGNGLRDADAPWRATQMTSLWWKQWQASGLSREEFEQQYSGRKSPRKQAFLDSIEPRDTSQDCHSLKSITLEITGEPVTKGKVEEVLAWFGSIPDDFWRNKLTSKQHDILSTREWKRD